MSKEKKGFRCTTVRQAHLSFTLWVWHVSPGSGDTPLTRPDLRSIKKIMGDGNCMFRALSRIVTGSQDQHSVIRAKIVQHMSDKASLMLAHIVAIPRFEECTSVQDYVHITKMDLLGSWGTDIELLCFEHLTNICVFTYITVQSNWERFIHVWSPIEPDFVQYFSTNYGNRKGRLYNYS